MKYCKTMIMLCLSAAFLCSCSGDNEQDKEPGRIDTMTKEIGQEAVRKIKTPLNKAQALADKEEKRAKELDERSSQ